MFPDAELSKYSKGMKLLAAEYEAAERSMIEKSATDRMNVEEDDDEKLCSICYCNEADAVFQPCRHTSCHGCV